MNRRIERMIPYAALAVLAILAWWPVATLQQVLRFDMIDQYLPWRQYATDCLRRGMLPLWNPYQHWGYFFCADPQSGTWYPGTWLAALAGGYSVYANQVDFVVHLVLAGWGMYALAKRHAGKEKAAFLVASAYMLSGFFTGNAQHLTYIVSGAWLPFVLATYTDLARRGTWRDALRFALCFAMMTTGGYPAFTIIAGYILAGLFAVYAARRWRSGEPMRPWLLTHAVAVMAFVLLCSFAFASIAESWGHAARSKALPLSDVLFNPFSPQSLVSLVFPLVTARDSVLFDTDISMSNLYFGLFALAGMLACLASGSRRRDKAVLAAGLFFLLAAFGGYTPVREFLYRHVPLLDLFRFPSIFRLFALVGFLLFAAGFFRSLAAGKAALPAFRAVLAVLCLAGTGTYAWISLHSGSWFPRPDAGSFMEFVGGLTIMQSLQVQALPVVLLTGSFLALLYRMRSGALRWLPVFVAVDLVVAVRLNAPITGYDRFRTHDVHAILRSLPHGFPVPANEPSKRYSDSVPLEPPFWRNLSLLRRQPGFDGFNSYRMDGYAQMVEQPELERKLLESPVAFLSGTWSFYNDRIDAGLLPAVNAAHLFFPGTSRPALQGHEPSATAGSVRFARFNPGLIEVDADLQQDGFLTLKQHVHPDWQVTVDGRPVKVFTSDYQFMSTWLLEGRHTVRYRFGSDVLTYSFLTSLFSFLLFPLALIPVRKKQGGPASRRTPKG